MYIAGAFEYAICVCVCTAVQCDFYSGVNIIKNRRSGARASIEGYLYNANMHTHIGASSVCFVPMYV